MHLQILPTTLHLRTTFRIAHGASNTRDNVLIRLDDGWGEAAAVAYHGETQAKIMAWLEQHRSTLATINEPAAIRSVLNQLDWGSHAARAAVDIALHDNLAKKIGVSLRSMLGLANLAMPQTSFTLPIAEPDELHELARAAAHYPILKIKLGGLDDLASIEIIRQAAPLSRLRVDANGGWTFAIAQEMISALSGMNVELVEQPLPADDIEGYRALHAARYPIPIFADEPIKRANDVAAWAHCVDGVNIKLMKTGGIIGALDAIATARAHGLQIMLGCMVESSVGVAAAAALAGLADFIDLDGPLLIANDPAVGLTFEGANLIMPKGAGLGVELG